MREKLVTLACALGALVLFALMFLRGEGPPTREIARPTSAERLGNGHFAAFTWLRSEEVSARSWREGFERLADPGRLESPRGNLLIVTLPVAESFRADELLHLSRWVRDGNSLLVLAPFLDQPEWASDSAPVSSAELHLLTALEFEALSGTERPFPPEREHAVLVPNRPHVYFEGVQSAVALTPAPVGRWRVKVPFDGFVLALAHERTSGEGSFWTRSLGEGRIIVSGYATLFTNRSIAEADNARLFANLVAANVGARGSVLFDDRHHGIGGTYDPNRFYRDPRLYATAAVLVALWLAWILGSTRLATPVARTPAPREAELVETSGAFYARVLEPAAAARAMIERFFARVRRRGALTAPDEPPWAYLERHPRVAPTELARLKSWYSRACAARRVPLVKLHNLIVRLEKSLT